MGICNEKDKKRKTKPVYVNTPKKTEQMDVKNLIEQIGNNGNKNNNNKKETKDIEKTFEFKQSIEIKKKTRKDFILNGNINNLTENKQNSKDTAKIENEIQTEKKIQRENVDNETENKDVKKISALQLKPEEPKMLKIQKDLTDIITNKNYYINLKLSIKKVKLSDNFSITLNQYLEKDKLNKKLIGTSETRTIKENQLVKFNHDFIIEFEFAKLQPLEFIIKMDKSQEEKLEISLGELIGSPRQIYFHNFSNFELQIEAKMQSLMEKKIVFLLGLFGNLKNMKFFYTISNLGNRYDNNKNDLVYKSDSMNDDSKIIFKQIELPLEKLSDDNNLEDDLIQIHFYSINDENKTEELGNEKFSLEKILENKEIKLNLKNQITAKISTERKNFYNLLQFLYNDFHLITTFCIDFSENNTVHNNNSLFKDYLKTFLDLLYPYNSDKFFHCYAYGFRLLKDKTDYINEIFPLNRKTPSIEMNDIITKYEKFLTKIEKASDKADLALIIRNLNNSIKNDYDLEDKEYNIFIIFACNDIENEIDFINELKVSSNLNISLIIIGIGSGSFNNIQNVINTSKGKILKRDCVKFIKIGNNLDENIKYSLNNIPNVMIDFFCENNFLPKN